MASKLLIVESPAKARTIGNYLGKEFEVRASVGHVRDLPKSKLGVDEEHDFEPDYQVLPDKKKVVEELRRAARKADEIYLATDPDREGEAISWHIAELLKDLARPMHRVEFHQITKNAVREAVAEPRELDMARVDAQQARRVVDRLMGYKISPLLWRSVRRGLSAGRVQSVALKMICDREDEIEAFTPEEYWLVDATVRAPEPPPFTVRLAKRDGKKWRPATAEEAEAVQAALKAGPLTIAKVSRRKGRQRPRAPFITSTLQQEASRRLGLPVRRTMQIAQRLYEGVELGDRGRQGLITYMRTDSVRSAPEAVEAARSVIAERFGAGAVPAKPNFFKNRSSAQDAHEAIRPVDPALTPDRVKGFLGRDELRLYRLIWERFVASQMKPAVFDVTKVEVACGPYTLSVEGKILVEPGFLALWQENGDGKEQQPLPSGLAEGQALTLEGVKLEQKFTQPPPRYTEATLVKALEEKGIGRPSTYAAIIATISGRDYVVREKKTFRPTELGRLVNRLLTATFADLIDEGYTARLEEELDRVAEGKEGWHALVRRFAESFARDLEGAVESMRELRRKLAMTEEKCPECGKPLVMRFGTNGAFLGCSGYPECRYTRNLGEAETADTDAAAPEGEAPSCPKCGAPMVQRRSRRGPFWGCSKYPECKGTRSLDGKTREEPKGTGVPCPMEGCDGELTARKSRYGKIFYSCNRYPKCRFAMNDWPVEHPCPECGFPIMGLRVTKRFGRQLVCPVKECGHRIEAPEDVAGPEGDG
ncbi:MAG TPA: type I DNA topoisomerase [Acidobacteria bacterium]|nr:type I DNA topoisomerase [Acidobacteriota bacterium]